MELVFECANVKLPNKLSNLLQNALHPVFGLLWSYETKIFVSHLENYRKSNNTVQLSLNKPVVTCQWIIESTNLLVVVSEDGEVSLWKFLRTSDNHFKQVATLKVQHRVDGMFQVPNQKTFLLMGKNETTVVNFRDADEVLLTTCILSFGCKCCCWSKHLQCLIASSHDAHLMFCKLLITEKAVNVEVFKRMQVSSSPGRLRNVTAVGRFILCNFDAPLEENIRTDITKSSGISTSQKADKIGTNNLHYMLNYTTELLSRTKTSPSSSSMVRVFQVDDNDETSSSSSSSSSPGLAEVACTALDDVILPDLTTTWELSATKFLVVVGSSRCSSLAVLVFDANKPGFELVDSHHFQGQKVRGVSMEGSRLFCLTTERQVGDPFLFLSLGCHGDAFMRLVTFAVTGADTIPTDNNETKYNHNNNSNNEDINTGDDDDDFELDESNFIIPGVFPPVKVERGRLVEEVEDQNERITITTGNDGNNFVCIHCGKTNSANQKLPAHHHGNVDLESMVTKVVQRELKKFKDEILCDLKSLILSEFQKK